MLLGGKYKCCECLPLSSQLGFRRDHALVIIPAVVGFPPQLYTSPLLSGYFIPPFGGLFCIISLLPIASVYAYLVSIHPEVDTALVSDLIFSFGGWYVLPSTGSAKNKHQ
jgi:hypothetical protein